MATLLVAGFTPRRGRDFDRERLVDWEARRDSGAFRQWDVIELRPDFSQPGRRESQMSYDDVLPNAPARRHLFFSISVPAISLGCKTLVETHYDVWPEVPVAMRLRHEAKGVPEPLRRKRCGFYVDFSALPAWAQWELLTTGKVTLNETDARRAIKHHLDHDCVRRLFTSFADEGQTMA